MGLDDGANVSRQAWVLLFATLSAPRGEVLQATHPVMKLVQSRLDRIASPAEASFGLAGVTAAQFGGDLGQEQAALMSGQPSGSRPNQGLEARDGVFHGVAQPDGRAVINRPRVSHHPAGQDSSGRGRFPPGAIRKNRSL